MLQPSCRAVVVAIDRVAAASAIGARRQLRSNLV